MFIPKIKVCGMKNSLNISELSALQPDFIGFIFYEKSARFVGENFAEKITNTIPENINKIGVFVNASADYIFEKVAKYKLNFVQLHGDEHPEFCKQIQEVVPVIKAFLVDKYFSFKILEVYLSSCSYFLFDTKTKLKGGSGKKFDWQLLLNYSADKPYFLSGGIGFEEIKNIKKITDKRLFSIDINSKFETIPAQKDIEKLRIFFQKLKN